VGAIAYEGWDQANKLFRVLLSNGMANYFTGGVIQGASVQAYDLARGQYAGLQLLIAPRCYIRYGLPQQPDAEMAPARMGARGIRCSGEGHATLSASVHRRSRCRPAR
jgi:hypothetical protein